MFPSHDRGRRISHREIDLILHCLGYSEEEPVILKQQFVAVAFLFAIETAMRRSEICLLKPEIVNLESRVASLPTTKNGTARKVPLTSEAKRLIMRVDCNFQLKPDVLSTMFLKAARNAGIDDLTFHDSRHEAITRLAKKMDILDLARAVGHKNINELQTYYNATAEEIAKGLD